MKKTFLLLFSLIFSFSIVMGQQWVPITSDIPQPATIELISSNIETTTINIKVGGYEMSPVITPNGTEHVISLPDAVSLSEEGAPDLYKACCFIYYSRPCRNGTKHPAFGVYGFL
jgi:hypothetical protein